MKLRGFVRCKPGRRCGGWGGVRRRRREGAWSGGTRLENGGDCSSEMSRSGSVVFSLNHFLFYIYIYILNINNLRVLVFVAVTRVIDGGGRRYHNNIVDNIL